MPFVDTNSGRLLYLHVPKTGGTSIEAWMKTVGPLNLYAFGSPIAFRCTPQHLRMSDIRELFEDAFFDAIFMTVRNPYDRVESEYRMRAVLGGQGFWNAYPSFSLWLEQALTATAKNPFHLGNHMRPQWEFLGNGVEVLKYEDGVETAIARMSTALNLPVPDTIPHLQKTSDTEIAIEWDTVDRIRVEEFYQKDFETFGYERHPCVGSR